MKNLIHKMLVPNRSIFRQATPYWNSEGAFILHQFQKQSGQGYHFVSYMFDLNSLHTDTDETILQFIEFTVFIEKRIWGNINSNNLVPSLGELLDVLKERRGRINDIVDEDTMNEDVDYLAKIIFNKNVKEKRAQDKKALDDSIRAEFMTGLFLDDTSRLDRFPPAKAASILKHYNITKDEIMNYWNLSYKNFRKLYPVWDYLEWDFPSKWVANLVLKSKEN